MHNNFFRQQFFAAAAAQARATAFANYRMPGPAFQNGLPTNPPGHGMNPGRLPFFNEAFFRPPYHFGMLGGHKSGELPPRPPHMNGFPFGPTPGAHGGHLPPLPPHHRPPFFPRIPDEFALRHNGFNQVTTVFCRSTLGSNPST